MLNREIEFRAVLDKLNEDIYFKKNIMWTVGPLGSYLKAKNVEFGLQKSQRGYSDVVVDTLEDCGVIIKGLNKDG